MSVKLSPYWQEIVANAKNPDGSSRPFFSMAPMEAVTDTVFRRVIAQSAGPDVYYTEFTNASSMVHPKAKFSVQGRLAVAPGEQQPIAQLWGSRPEELAGAVKLLPEMGYQAVDLNMGCPDGTVIKNSAGSDLIRHPDRALALIEAGKQAGIPLSVKTRLGFYRAEEFREWLPILLQADIQVLTVHLRSRKEMSKAPAHYEYIDEILAMRDELAPQTLIQFNGDIADYQAGMALVKEHPGIDGIMIGRGVLENPYAFEPVVQKHSLAESIGLLELQLQLFDEVNTAKMPKHFEALKRYFKIYLRGFPHAAHLRLQLMETHSTAEVREILMAEKPRVLAFDQGQA
ncbi:tRNA dihydrouridine synthase [Convivina praedatoris]|uniref:tRNA-dihydrouridine synthase n=1 Tax=Convivina praedatoris TaxID=2880963 RepID=A0ABN8H927_9LACO|nr:tRNA-dihydrouridine synthase [Convivina sp. LMG 32447]CAH1852308.1 putative tRNA-dihydrouridine synthase [Convivina sp. LMG 32447]CAH1853609.1 putative tRNA-dihydrouridine synthase [Convivina sp. LMG 32447]CAH1854452.1 putative tRNA-dihydrouridine synthase [Convivina sp. LMG 32447]